MESNAMLSLDRISKSFGEVKVLHDVSLEVGEGRIVGLVGQNGAGKSTLMKILAGVHPHGSYTGVVRVDGTELTLGSPGDAIAQGLGIVPQETSTVDTLSVAENVVLGTLKGWVNPGAMRRDAASFLSELGIRLDVRQPAATCTTSEKQLLMIARTLYARPKVLILDEPTTALTATEVDRLLGFLTRLRATGVTVILISHKLDELFRVCDHIAVLRDGRLVDFCDRERFDPQAIIQHMVGRRLDALYPRPIAPPQDSVVLDVSQLRVAGDQARGRRELTGISFSVRAGEVLGIAGPLGSGRTELLEALAGMTRWRGQVRVAGREVRPGSQAASVEAGICLVPEDRKRDALFANLSVTENLVIGSGKYRRGPLRRRRRETEGARRAIGSFGIKVADPRRSVLRLSGGNQQKVVIARALEQQPKVLLLDEPTKGVDVGAKRDIYSLLRDRTAQGLAVVAVFSDEAELIGLCDRVLVLSHGAVMRGFDVDAGDEALAAAILTGDDLLKEEHA
ncbi:sugar ABC transporter ATP-binding protein [Nonomuraea sp. H19]|uniref:sugar ABC transporter ATP-binding protein n=1 Tax=Nonomuraea sp. H19 TaxID=3452206 RepID=UPI003F88759D